MPFSQRCFLATIFLLCLCSQSFAQTETKEAAKSSSDEFHTSVSNRVMTLANRIDSFFGEKRALDAKNKSSLVLSLTQDVPEGGIPSPRFEAAMNLRLINLEKVSRDFENSVLGKHFEKINSGVTTGPGGSGQEPGPAEGELVNPWRLVLDQQVGAKWLPTYSAKLRLTKDFYTGDIFQHFSQDYGWDTDNLWSARTSLVSDYALDTSWLFRWVNEAAWYFDHILITSSHGPSLIHTIDDWTSMSYNLRLSTEYLDNRILYTSGYLASVTFRRDLYKKWVFLDLVPSVTFPRLKDFTRVFNFGISFQLVFGDL